MSLRIRFDSFILFTLLIGLTNLGLLIPLLRPLSAVLLTLILPGWGWTTLFLSQKWQTSQTSQTLQITQTFKDSWLSTLTLSLGLSFALTTLTTLTLHYLPGPIITWQLLITLNLIALLPHLLPYLLPYHNQTKAPLPPCPPAPLPPCPPAPLLPRPSAHPFIAILLLAIFLRFANLSYSEFQGDEALVMIFAAEAIEGHEDALFLRGKGPGEILLPLAIWRLTGPITEHLARIPFAIAGVFCIITLYLIAKTLFSPRTALYSAGFFAASGFTVGFSRIVQYQMLVIWMGALAFWTLWQWRSTKQLRWAFVSGLLAGIGLLAHYDLLLILPLLAWLMLETWYRPPAPKEEGDDQPPPLWGAGGAGQRGVGRLDKTLIRPIILWLTGFLSSTLPFYVPYFLDPQISSTGSYLGDRIGGGVLKNNLAAFLHFNSFYSSFYYTLLIGLLLIGFVIWALHRNPWSQGWGSAVAAAIAGIGLIGLAWRPDILGLWTAIPYSLLLLTVFLSKALTFSHRLGLIWFAVPFLGYNFAVARPLTHIYTVIPGWALLAGWTMAQAINWAIVHIRLKPSLILGLNIALTLLFSGYLWQAFVRHDLSFLQNYPASKPTLYWTPYSERPETGFFGFPHRAGWKSVGTLLIDGTLKGDYDSNEEEDISSWYTHHAPRACDPGAEFYFIANDLVDAMPLPADLLATHYQPIGQTTLQTGKIMTIQQQTPTTLNLGDLDSQHLARQFDQSAYPAAFARMPNWEFEAGTNFGGQIQLLGYDLDTHRAYPGGRVILTLYWQQWQQQQQVLAAEQQAQNMPSYKIFVQLDPNRKFAQADSYPVCARYPTNLWRPGQIIADQHALHLSPETPLGPIPLAVGLYLPEDGRRLDILDVAGNPAGVSLILTQVEVRAN